MDISFLFFEDFETLDVFGPVEILARIDGVRLNYVSLAGGLIRSRQGYAVDTVPLDTADPAAVLVIPGGQGTRRLVNDEDFIRRLKAAAGQADYVLTVCTGSALLAKTGLLDGRAAASNRKAFGWARSVSGKPDWQEDARWTADGKYYTSAGVSAGMDMALAFVSDRCGDEKAAEIAADIEYAPCRAYTALKVR